VIAIARWRLTVDGLVARPVVLDISMPVLNGIQAAECLRQADPDARIVFLTVEKDPDICLAAL
jgi:DNA-binding NarL/FixJ family response regulator